MVDAGGREVRVSNPSRVIFPETERTAAVTKRDIVQLLRERRGRDHARAARAADDARALAQGRASRASCSRPVTGAAATPSTRSGFPRARRTTCRRRGSSSPRAATPTRSARPSSRSSAGRRQMGTITFHPWPVRARDVDHPDELRMDFDPQPGTDFADAARVAGEARALLDELGYTGFPEDLGRPRHPHLRPDRAALDVHRRPPRRDRLRPRARSAVCRTR